MERFHQLARHVLIRLRQNTGQRQVIDLRLRFLRPIEALHLEEHPVTVE
ncbi:MAG TPA: hypothetical protein VME43_15030 [Bryobacteraceae bacterium]|nr:hypothetical protein [Bryobacteraceae bacterium]